VDVKSLTTVMEGVVLLEKIPEKLGTGAGEFKSSS
jgi:hypothetical protein